MGITAFLGQPGWVEILVVLFVVLLLFGSKRLPKLARSLGSSLTEFKKGLKGEDEEEKDKLPPPEQKSEQEKAGSDRPAS